ncbi:MAG: restriction endonuclease subunit S [Bacteriodetes bacterium]|nr:restriction endonuclease subunit S [Bacteroidota bacterium]
MKWERKTINDLCEIKGGKRLPKNHELIEVETNHPYIRARDIGNGIIDFSKPVYLQENTFNFISRYTVKADDIVMTIVGANIGDVGIIPKHLDGANLTENAVKLTSFNENCHFKYLLYYFLLPGKKKQLEQVAAGSAQGKLGLYKIKDIEVPIPPLPTQRRIASILSAYDDLIENNIKRIKLLEEKAQLHYKELMQEMSYSKTKREEYIKDCLAFYIGGGWGEEDYKEGFTQPAFVIRGTDIPDAKKGEVKGVPFRYHKESNLASRSMQAGDIVFEVSGGSKGQPVGRSILITEKMLQQFGKPVMCASFCKMLRPNENVTPEFFYLYLLASHENGVIAQYEKHSASNIVNYGFEEFIGEQKITIPKESELRAFTEKVKPIFTLISTLGEQNTKLREARDILLPRLMNGEIEV